MKLEKEENINSKLINRIKYLEFLNSSLTQTNKLLSSKLYSLTKKYNDLKNELYDTECHINFCQQNLVKLISFKKEEDIQKKDKNFLIFKNKIKTLFKYDDDFMKTNSEIIVYNMIIDNIENIQAENIYLRKNLDELKKIIYQNDVNNNEYYPINICDNKYFPGQESIVKNKDYIQNTKEKYLYKNNENQYIDENDCDVENDEFDDNFHLSK